MVDPRNDAATLAQCNVAGDKIYTLDGITTLGRAVECQIVFENSLYPTVSTYHARITRVEDGAGSYWQIQDLHSSNGTYINDKRVLAPQILMSGDRVGLSLQGPQFIFQYQPPFPPEIIPSQDAGLVSDAVEQKSAQPSSVDPRVPPTVSTTAIQNHQAQSSPVVDDRKVGLATERSLWTLSQTQSFQMLAGHTNTVKAVAFSVEGKRLISGSADKTVQVWDLETGRVLYTLEGHKLGVNAVAFSPRGELVASGSADKTVRVWRLGCDTPLFVLEGHGLSVNAVAFSADGGLLISGGADKTIRVWNLQTGVLVKTLESGKMGVAALAFCAEGARFLEANSDRTLKLWDLQTGQIIETVTGLRMVVNSLHISPKGQGFVMGCEDKTVRLWRLDPMEEVQVVAGFPWLVGGLGVSTDGCRLASGCEDNLIKLWEF
jgi:WD40 repeat protein